MCENFSDHTVPFGQTISSMKSRNAATLVYRPGTEEAQPNPEATMPTRRYFRYDSMYKVGSYLRAY